MRKSQILLLCLAVAGGCQREDEALFFSDIPYPGTGSRPGDGIQLELVGEYGDRDEGLVFGEILGLAVSESGTLAVLDRVDCRIWIVDTRTRAGRVLGRCGDGPGEFRMPFSATFSGDTLVVFDLRRGVSNIVRLTLAGEEIDRFTPDLAGLGALRVSSLNVGQGGSLLAGLELMPNSMSAEDLQVVSFDGFGGTVSGRGLAVPPIARETPYQVVRSSSLCVGVTEEEGEVIFAANTWGPQVALLRASDFQPLESLRIPAEWAQAHEHSLRPGHWGPTWPLPETACGERYGVAAYRRQERVSPGVLDVREGVLAFFEFKTRSLLILGGGEPPDQGSVFLFTPGAATGDRFFFFTNEFSEFPLVREYRIVNQEDH